MLEDLKFCFGSYPAVSKTIHSILHIWLGGIAEPRQGNLTFPLHIVEESQHIINNIPDKISICIEKEIIFTFEY